VRTENIPEIPGAFLLYPDLHHDERGLFVYAGDTRFIPEAPSWRWCMTRSAAGVLRGMHVRTGEGEAKLIRCTRGRIYDVIIDLRKGSPAYRAWAAFRLSGAGQVSLYIPPGCAHGYQALSGPAEVSYQISGIHDPAAEVTIAHDDPELAILWPPPVTAMSARDRGAMTLAEVEKTGLLTVI